MKKDKDYIAALFYDISLRYRVLMTNDMHDKIKMHEENINRYINEYFKKLKIEQRNTVDALIDFLEKKAHDNTSDNTKLQSLTSSLKKMKNNKRTQFSQKFLSEEDISLLRDLKVYNTFATLDTFYLLKRLKTNDIIRILIYFYGRAHDESGLVYSWFCNKCAEQFSTLETNNKIILSSESLSSCVLDFFDYSTADAFSCLHSKPKFERNKIERIQYLFYESIDWLFDVSKTNKVIASNIDTHYNLAIEMLDDVESIIYESAFFVPEQNHVFDVKYLHFLSQENIYDLDLIATIPAITKENSTSFPTNAAAYENLMMGFIFEIGHEEFSIDEACEQIKKSLYKLCQSYKNPSQKAFLESSSKFYGSKNQKDIEHVFWSMIFWNFTKKHENLHLNRKETHSKFCANSENRAIPFSYNKYTETYKEIELEIKKLFVIK